MKNKKLFAILGIAAIIAIAIIVTVVVLVNKGHRVIKVESFSGDVVLERDDSKKDIFKNMNLKTKDVITTGEDGLIGLLVDDDKNIAATENTCFAIVSTGNEKKGALKIELKYGKSLIEIKNKLPDGSSFEVETPNATLSVRGTRFEVTYTKETKTTVLKVTEGCVQVDTKTKTDKVDAGKTAIIKDDNIEISSSDANTDNNKNDSTSDTRYVKIEDWSDLLKGGADYKQLEYLLRVVSRCKYENEEDYLKNALYWLCDEEYEKVPIVPIEELENGENVYDVATINKIFSFLTDDTISEDNLNPDINRLDGDKLICKNSPSSINRIASAAIYEAYYSEEGEIVIKYAFNVVAIDTLEPEQFTKYAYLLLDETGKYVLDHIE
ncbi:MAG: hypothetical protein E7252_05515 [Lachnospira sp.]|nr:hypothetical protein [Lachnospira sp.]